MSESMGEGTMVSVMWAASSAARVHRPLSRRGRGRGVVRQSLAVPPLIRLPFRDVLCLSCDEPWLYVNHGERCTLGNNKLWYLFRLRLFTCASTSPPAVAGSASARPAALPRPSPPRSPSPSPTPTPTTWRPASNGPPPSASSPSARCAAPPCREETMCRPPVSPTSATRHGPAALEAEYLGGTGWPGLLDKHSGHDPLAVDALIYLLAVALQSPKPTATVALARVSPRQRTQTSPRRPQSRTASRDRTRQDRRSVTDHRCGSAFGDVTRRLRLAGRRSPLKQPVDLVGVRVPIISGSGPGRSAAAVPRCSGRTSPYGAWGE